MQDHSVDVGPWADDDDDRGCGSPGLGLHEVDEVVQGRVGVGGVGKQEAGRPGVGADLVGACGGDVGVGVIDSVDGGDGVGEELRDGISVGSRRVVDVDAVWVE
ncbi:MAG: hypothetical protein BWY91_03047 [bacterium ADurb.BinA028]|nr:MAG: hypothetical protein BWY91_03047 [bacterium ADurb.BinA028]